MRFHIEVKLIDVVAECVGFTAKIQSSNLRLRHFFSIKLDKFFTKIPFQVLNQ